MFKHTIVFLKIRRKDKYDIIFYLSSALLYFLFIWYISCLTYCQPKDIYWLIEESETEKERKKESSHSLADSSNACNGQQGLTLGTPSRSPHYLSHRCCFAGLHWQEAGLKNKSWMSNSGIPTWGTGISTSILHKYSKCSPHLYCIF